jgi:very-short-patch-repair endonuclease
VGWFYPMTRLFNKTPEKEKRRILRKNMPPAETILWSKLRGKNLHGCKFRRQYSIGPYIVDFYSPKLKLAIELDGESHFVEGALERDNVRQAFIESAGITVLRFTNCDIYDRLEGVIEKILEKIPETHLPQPLLGKEGDCEK